MVKAKPICALDDIPLIDGNVGEAALELKIDNKKIFVLAIRQGDEVFLYKNSCPHIGSPLDFDPGRFLNPDNTHILCATHGALFEIDNGKCIYGPCEGKDLEAIPCRVEGSNVWLA